MIGAALTPTPNTRASALYGGLVLVIACIGNACGEDPAHTPGAGGSRPGVPVMPMAPSTAGPKPTTPPTAMSPVTTTPPTAVMPMVPPTAQSPAGGAAAPAPEMM